MTAGVNIIDEIVNIQPGTIDGDVTINYSASEDLVLPVGLVITGNLTVDAPNATVNNHARIEGDLIIKDVSENTWNEYANTNKIVFNAEGKTLNLRSGVGSLAINVNSNLITRRQLKGVRVGAGVVVKVKATVSSTKSTTLTGSGGQETITPPAVPVRYVLATDADFEKINSWEGSYFKYIGTAEYVEIPHEIGGEILTSYILMFKESSVKGVKSSNENIQNMGAMFYKSQASSLDLRYLDTSNVTNMSSMFNESQASSLDLRSFDTSKVTNMGSMFNDSKAENLDLSNFDTSEVTNMGSMFNGSRASTLDLSNFDTSEVTNMGSMFKYSQATTGYARTPEDAGRFNASSNKPAGLNFTVK